MEIHIKYDLKLQELLSTMPLNELLKLSKDAEKELLNRKCTPVDRLNVGVRAKHIFNKYNISCIEQFENFTYDKLIVVKDAGKKTVTELVEELKKHGLIIKYCEKCKASGKIWNNQHQRYDPCPDCA